MDVTREDALEALAEAAALAPGIRIDIDAEYLRHIAVIEAMPSNQPGTDKTWVWRAAEAFRAHYRAAKPA